jgi:hypothetical protein
MNKELTIRSSYMKEKKEALIVLGIAIPLLSYGAFSFELQGGGSNFEAISVAVSLTLGLFGVIGGLILFFTKNSLGLIGTKAKSDSKRIRSPEELKNLTIDDEFNKLRAKATKPKPIIKKEKEMKEDKPITQEVKKGSSVDLMKREKDLLTRRTQLNTYLSETETELNQVRENLETKGWVNSDDGWVIE